MNAPRLQDCILEAFSTADDVIAQTGSRLIVDKKDDIVCEVMTHPGYVTGTEGGCGDGPDEFSQSSDREYEMSVLMSAEMREFYKKENIKLVSFHDVKVI